MNRTKLIENWKYFDLFKLFIARINFCIIGFIFSLSITNAQEICDNGIDDDFDNYIDCYDAECPCNFNDCSVGELEQEFSIKESWRSTSERIHSHGTPIIGNLDPLVDSIPEILVPTHWFQGEEIHIYKGDGSNASNPDVIDLGFNNSLFAPTPCIGDINADGIPEVIVNSEDHYIIVYTDYQAGDLQPLTKWMTSSEQNESRDDKLALADFNMDGISEIYSGRTIFEFDINNGSLERRLIGTGASGNMFGFESRNSVAADLLSVFDCGGDPDCDGLEIAAGTVIYSVDLDLNDGDGYEMKIQRDLADFEPNFLNQDGYTAVADMDNDGILDVIVSFASSGMGPHVWNKNGLVASFDLPSNDLSAQPAVAEIYDDTESGALNNFPEIIVTTQYRILAYNLNAKNLGFDKGAWWELNTTDGSGRTGATVFDFNGDNISEIVYRDENNLRIMYGGAEPFPIGVDNERNWNSFSVSSSTWEEFPVVADIDNDGESEIVVTGVPLGDFQDYLLTFESDLMSGDPWMSARQLWNQYAYFHVNVNDDLTIPKQQQLHHLEFPGPGSDFRPFNTFLNQSSLLDLNYNSFLPIADAQPIVDTIYCEGGEVKVLLTLCNYGDAPLDESVALSFYDADPTSQAANLIATLPFLQEIDAGDCLQSLFSIPFSPTEIFVVANDEGLIPPPYSFEFDFPVTNIQECYYHNNIDSFAGVPNMLNPIDLGIEATICESDSFLVDIGSGWSTIIWSDDDSTRIRFLSDTGWWHVYLEDGCFNSFSDTFYVEPGIDKFTSDTITLCEGQFAVVHGQIQTIEGLYIAEIDLGGGCDSTSEIYLKLESSYFMVDTFVICEGDSIYVHDSIATQAGIYHGNFITNAGCDSTHITSLFLVPPADTIWETITICLGDSALVNGSYVSQEGQYQMTFTSQNGCDSVSIVDLIIYHHTVYDTLDLCIGDSIYLNDEYIYSEGSYIDSLVSFLGCDSIIFTTIIAQGTLHHILDTFRICEGDSVLIHGSYEFSEGMYEYFGTGVTGCDSTHLSFLEIKGEHIMTIDTLEVCAGDSVFIHYEYELQNGIYLDTFNSIVGCDSISSVHLVVHPSLKIVDSISACANTVLILQGQEISSTGEYVFSYPTQHGCDSEYVYHVDILDTAAIYILPNILCSGLDQSSLSLQVQSDLAYDITWNPGNGTQEEILGLVEGIYTVEVESINGCVSSVKTDVTPLQNDTLDYQIQYPLCPLDGIAMIDFEFAEGYSYGVIGGAQNLGSSFELAAGEYALYTLSPDGCEQEIYVSIMLDDPLNVSLDSVLFARLGEEILLEASITDDRFMTSQWMDGSEILCSNCLIYELIATQNDQFVYLALDSNGCEYRYELDLIVDVYKNIYVPNVFSPNNDGLNDLFRPYTDQRVKNLNSFKIADRWGNLVYEIQSPVLNEDFGWDGWFKSKKLNPDVFLWVIEVEYVDGRIEQYSGDLTLIH